MVQTQKVLTATLLLSFHLLACTRVLAVDDSATERVLASGRQAMLDRHYVQAARIIRVGLKEHPRDNQLRLELGRAYLANGSDRAAIRMFREVLTLEPENRWAKLELARALGYAKEYKDSDRIYQELLAVNAADEAAAIGLASNLLHQLRSSDARDVIDKALAFHPDSLRLQEYEDRIANGQLGGEEREQAPSRNLVEGGAEYLNDSGGNHSWRFLQRIDFGIRAGLTGRVLFEQHLQHSRDDTFDKVETFAEQLRWRPREWLTVSAGGGAVRFNNHDVHALYDTSLAFQPRQHLVFGGTFSRVPIIPDAEATEHRITAQGWDTFANWTPQHWQINIRGSQQHYSDENIGTRESAEIIREWPTPHLTFETGYRYRHAGFDQELAHGYFNPDSYHSHLGMVGVRSQLGKRYRGTLLVRGGMESAAADVPFRAASEIYSANEFLLGRWTLALDYSNYHAVQDTGAFRADSGRFTFTYHF